MINEEILSLIGMTGAAYYSKIGEWDSWWRGHDRSFHEFCESGVGGRLVRRELYRMNMAKKICEDWAALLLNDRTSVKISDEAGTQFVRDVFSSSGFMAAANRLVEKAFALGTGAVILRLSGVGEIGGKLTADGAADVSFEFVDAQHIVPISVVGGRITEAAFVSGGIMRGEEYTYIETHTLGDDGYVIGNEIYVRENGSLVKREADGFAEEIHTHSKIPLFSILTPNIQNNIDQSLGLGVSVFADAIDCLKGVDLAFNNFCRDIKLGGKKVFINQSLIKRDDCGNVITPDDVAQQLFVTLGDSDFSDNPMIVEHNPELRSAENAEAVQCQLNYLSFRCGLGTHHYVFSDNEGRTRLTAAQYMGERQDMRQNVSKHQKNVEAFLVGVVRSLLWCASEVFGIEADVGAAVGVIFDDAYFGDSETYRSRDLEEVKCGIMTAEEYREKWIGGAVNG